MTYANQLVSSRQRPLPWARMFNWNDTSNYCQAYIEDMVYKQMKKMIFLSTLLSFISPGLVLAEYLEVSDAWIRASSPNAKVLAAYGNIKNKSDYTIWVTGISSPAFNSVDMHETVQSNGMASMNHLNFIRLEPGQTVNFKPAGKHFMLFTPKKPLKVEQKVDFQLHLGNGDKEDFQATVYRHKP